MCITVNLLIIPLLQAKQKKSPQIVSVYGIHKTTSAVPYAGVVLYETMAAS